MIVAILFLWSLRLDQRNKCALHCTAFSVSKVTPIEADFSPQAVPTKMGQLTK